MDEICARTGGTLVYSSEAELAPLNLYLPLDKEWRVLREYSWFNCIMACHYV